MNSESTPGHIPGELLTIHLPSPDCELLEGREHAWIIFKFLAPPAMLPSLNSLFPHIPSITKFRWFYFQKIFFFLPLFHLFYPNDLSPNYHHLCPWTTAMVHLLILPVWPWSPTTSLPQSIQNDSLKTNQTFTNHIFKKALISRKYKEYSKL